MMVNKIITANTWFSTHPGNPVFGLAHFLERWVIPEMSRSGVPFLPESVDDRLNRMAHVNQGKWIVSCPCGGAEKAWEEGLVMCLSCFNSHVGHRMARTRFPDDREEIERLLLQRPLLNRNWLHTESVDDLLMENREHVKELL